MRFAPVLLAVSVVLAQAGPKTPDDRIRAVETGLMPAVVLKGRPVPRYTLEERMKALNVRGVSIAVIRNYEIEWAKGYGFADLESKRAVTAETLFQAGSISKPVAAVAASGYRANGDAVPGRYHTYPEMAAAGLWTTAGDLARFAIEILKSREGRSNRILKQATVDEMLREQKQGYGLGFGVTMRGGTKEFGHGGADEGFQALLTATADGRGLVVMTNSDNGQRLASEIVLAVAAAYGWPNKPRERETISLSAENLAKFAGEYEAGRLGRVHVRVVDDHLVLSIPQQGEVALYPQAADVFFSLERGVPDLKFSRDEAGAITSVTGGNVTARRVK